jgi:hypothetical protein
MFLSCAVTCRAFSYTVCPCLATSKPLPTSLAVVDELPHPPARSFEHWDSPLSTSISTSISLLEEENITDGVILFEKGGRLQRRGVSLTVAGLGFFASSRCLPVFPRLAVVDQLPC